MSEVGKTLFAKAIDDLEAAAILLPNGKQHDNAGAHLCKTAEKFGKAYSWISHLIRRS